MWRVLSMVVVVCLVCLTNVKAQTVNETETQILLNETSSKVVLSVENPRSISRTKSKIEFLNPNGEVKAFSEADCTLVKGKNKIEIPVSIGEIVKQEDFAFYRLRYQVGDFKGTMAISQITAEVFDLEAFTFNLLQEDGRYRIRVRAIQPIKLTGVANVKLTAKLEIEFNEQQEKTLEITALTDTDGFADLEFQIPNLKKIEDVDLTVKGIKNGFSNELSKDSYSSNFHQYSFLYFQTDKPIYQPAQIFRLRSLFFDFNKKAIADEVLTFSVIDPEGATIQRMEAKTSRFGVANIEWQIPENAKLGEYKIVAEGNGEIANNQKYFKISRYDLPNFAVSAEPNHKFYLPDQKNALIEIRAAYLFGKPVTKAKVRVVREFDREWNYKLQKYEIKNGESREGELNAKGKFTANFDLSKEQMDYDDNDSDSFKDLRFAAYVTDLTTNRTEQKRFDLRLTKKPIHIYLVGETYDLSKGLPPRFYLTTFYADGTPAACEVKIYQKHKDSDEDHPKPGTLLARLKTNDIGAAKTSIPLNILDEDDDDLDLVITANDAQGNKSLTTKNLSFDKEKPAVQVETDKIVYRKGENVKVSIISSQPNDVLYLDVMRGWQTVHNEKVKLENGRAAIEVPYQEGFKNALTFVVYGSMHNKNGDSEIFADSKTIVYPSPFGLRVKAEAEKDIWRPGEEALVNISAQKNDGTTNETAFGVVVLDKAIEERARTDSEFGLGYQSFYSDLEGLLGLGWGFGGISGFDIDNLDTSKPLSDEARLAIEITIRRRYFPQIKSENFVWNLTNAYSPIVAQQIRPIRDLLNKHYTQEALIPTDKESLEKVLAIDGINLDSCIDPWGNPYQFNFFRHQDLIDLEIKSTGPNKKSGDADDVTAITMSFRYFYATGQKIDKAFTDYRERTDDFIRDYKTLRQELRRQNVEVDALRDPWGKPYRFEFSIENSTYVMHIKSGGWNKKFGGYDDFTMWTNVVDYFSATRANISREFRQTVRDTQRFPRDEAEFKDVLKQKGFDLDTLKDIFGRPYYIETEKKSLFNDKLKVESSQKTEITPITQGYVTFDVKSVGRDSIRNTNDDFELVRFTGIVSEKTKDSIVTNLAKPVPASISSRGAIQGNVFDMADALIPDAKVTAVWSPVKLKFEIFSDESGKFIFADLPPGPYELTLEAKGFKKTIIQNVSVRSQQLTEIDVQMEVGNVAESVTVIGNSENVLNTSSASVAMTITEAQIQELPLNGRRFEQLIKLSPGASAEDKKNIKAVTKSGADNGKTNQPIETPRLREYFPETLVWSPEIVTDQTGKAQVKFKLADSLTTWKIGVIGSTVNGDVGMAEKEIKSFQPFFAELEPPKFLTEGDEIKLPVTIRNYLSEKQKVRAEMSPADWFRFLGSPTQTSDAEPNSSVNTVFDFQAVKPIKNGKQRVTVNGTGDASDAIEKSVTVRPNGQEIVKTQSELFTQSMSFDVSFPQKALPKMQNVELKIYPNLMAHVTESVEGLLKRPYGCGEQTISATYPNLMILKFTKGESKLKLTAQNYLKKGYDRLLGYKAEGGGFTYWGKGEPDTALTAYAYRFLTDAGEFIKIDEKTLAETRDYLVKKQNPDGSFNGDLMQTAYVARTLARNAKDEKSYAALNKALDFLKNKIDKYDEPYAIALYGLALSGSGKLEEAKMVAERLEKLSKPEGGAVYWNLETNTPFYAWGIAGRTETTALVVQLLSEVSRREATAERNSLIAKGTIFLLKNKDRYGVWYSTQTTINVLDTFLTVWRTEPHVPTSNTLEVLVNGEKFQDINVAPTQITPIILNLTDKLTPTVNRLEIKNHGQSALMSQVISDYYIDWKDLEISKPITTQASQMRLDYKCDKPDAAIMQEITCTVEAERAGFKGYGMLLAEIGLPPGADVSREALEALKDDNILSHYEILPDRIIVYMWTKPGGTKFDFKFRPRYGINAQTPASIVYDYYNPEASATAAPIRFLVSP